MANLILPKVSGTTTVSITLASLANTNGRISAQIDNSTTRYPRGKIGIQITTGAVAPTANTVYKVYLIEKIGTLQGGGIGAALGTADAAVTIEPVNAPCVGVVQCRATANDLLTALIDVGGEVALPDHFSILIWNASGQAAAASGHVVEFTPLTDEIQ